MTFMGDELTKDDIWRWYECERKVPHTQETAEQQVAEWDTIRSPYRCPYGDHWHVGRKPQNDKSRYRRRHARFQKALRAWRLAHAEDTGAVKVNEAFRRALEKEEARGRELALKLDNGRIIRDPTWRCVADVMKSFSAFGATRAYGILIYADTGEVHPHCAHLVDPDSGQAKGPPLG